jgi:hypothetical protein
MTFVNPQAEDSPAFAAQACVNATDLAAMLAASTGNGWVSGCAVTPRNSGVDLNVAVAAGSVVVGGANVTVAAAANVAVGAASSTDRRDIITVNASGVVSSTAGTPCTVAGWTPGSNVLPPVKPAIPASSALLAEVYVPGTATSITADNITAKGAPTTPAGTTAGTILARAYYQPVSSTQVAATGSTADIDATNLAVTFIVPASGSVTVFLNGQIFLGGANAVGWGVREGTTDVVAPVASLYNGSGGANGAVVRKFLVTGLTPGASHTYKWTQKTMFGSGGGFIWGGGDGPGIMEVAVA